MAKSFGSDNHSGIHPRILKAIAEANSGHSAAYGDDPYTARFEQMIKHLFGNKAKGFLVMNGTGANILSLKALAAPAVPAFCAVTLSRFLLAALYSSSPNITVPPLP